jgi:heme exporter protein A
LGSAIILECRDIAFERDDEPLFEGVSFSVSPGDILQVTGANGSGKTTLMRLLATVLTASAGDIHWRGKSVSRRLPAYRADMLYLGHQPGIKSGLTPRENLQWLVSLSGAATGIDAALAEVGLADYADVPCHTLSAGQLRRVALARLLTGGASLWLLDEPLTAIDRDGIDTVQTLMARHVAGGGAIVVTTHQDLALTGVRRLEMARYAA